MAKSWNEVREELRKSPEFEEEYAKLQPAYDRVLKYIEARANWSNRGLSQRGLANKAKVPLGFVIALEDFEGDISSIPPEALSRIHLVLGIS